MPILKMSTFLLNGLLQQVGKTLDKVVIQISGFVNIPEPFFGF